MFTRLTEDDEILEIDTFGKQVIYAKDTLKERMKSSRQSRTPSLQFFVPHGQSIRSVMNTRTTGVICVGSPSDLSDRD